VLKVKQLRSLFRRFQASFPERPQLERTEPMAPALGGFVPRTHPGFTFQARGSRRHATLTLSVPCNRHWRKILTALMTPSTDATAGVRRAYRRRAGRSLEVVRHALLGRGRGVERRRLREARPPAGVVICTRQRQKPERCAGNG
jgi:hypothetical protein